MPDNPPSARAASALPTGLPAAFALTGSPSRLPGGQGTCWRVGDAVLKPGQDPAEASWLAEVFADLAGPGFRVPRPVRAVDGSWVVAGWAAWAWVDGEPDPLARWPELVAVSRAFHAALAGRGRPRWVGRGTSPWAVADRVAWGEATTGLVPELADLVDGLLAAMRPVRLPSQLVHGDIAGNVLFAAGQSPGGDRLLAVLAAAGLRAGRGGGGPAGLVGRAAGHPGRAGGRTGDRPAAAPGAGVPRGGRVAGAGPAGEPDGPPSATGPPTHRAAAELRAVRRATQPVTELLLARAAVLDSGRDP